MKKLFFVMKQKQKFFLTIYLIQNQKKKINTILIGPEGGFSLSEKNFLKNLDYVYGLSLGKRIFRADTAAISSLSLLINIKNK